MIGKCGHNLSFFVFVSSAKHTNENCKRVATKATAAAEAQTAYKSQYRNKTKYEYDEKNARMIS